MSTGIGFYCDNCNSQSPTYLNWGVENCQWLFHNRQIIITLMELDQKYSLANCFIDFCNFEYLDWMQDHYKHALALCDEYGRLFHIDAKPQDITDEKKIGDIKRNE